MVVRSLLGCLLDWRASSIDMTLVSEVKTLDAEGVDFQIVTERRVYQLRAATYVCRTICRACCSLELTRRPLLAACAAAPATRR